MQSFDRNRKISKNQTSSAQRVTPPAKGFVDNRPLGVAQRKLQEVASSHRVTSQRKGKTGLPEELKAKVEEMSGYSLDDVKVHYNSSEPAHIDALAFARGTDIYLAPGQEKHLAHELWHVVQQKQGRVRATSDIDGVSINDSYGLEAEAERRGLEASVTGVISTPSSLHSNVLVSDVAQRVIGNNGRKGQNVKRLSDGKIFEIARVDKEKDKNTKYKVKSTTGKKEHLIVRSGNTDFEISKVAPQSTVPVTQTQIAVKSPEEMSAEKLATFKVINLMDHASTGTGHQAAMAALINNLATLNYKGDIHLTYSKSKTKWWSGKLNSNITDATVAFNRHSKDWDINYSGLKIKMHPLGQMPDNYGTLFTGFKSAVSSIPATEEVFWNKIWWDGATGCTASELKSPMIYRNKKFLSGDAEFAKIRSEIGKKSNEWLVAELSGSFGEALTDAPKVNSNPTPSNETLTIYAAFDSRDLSKGLVDTIRTMTGEADPWTLILQPFLWANDDHATPRVMHGEKMEADIQAFIESQSLVPVYPQTPVSVTSINDFVDSKDGNAPNKELVKSLLNKAKSNSINLISAYYTQASASDVPYAKLLEILIEAFGHQDIASVASTPIVIALLGGEASTAHTEIFDTLKAAGKSANLVKGTGDESIIADLTALSGKIVIEHIGRTSAMPLFEQYSTFFVTEGANTWQETLTVGKPSLSARPSGETRPWENTMGSPGAASMVRKASEALVALAKKPSGTDLKAEAEMTDLIDFIKDLRKDRSSDVIKYFQKWKDALSNPAGNQLVAAVNKLK